MSKIESRVAAWLSLACICLLLCPVSSLRAQTDSAPSETAEGSQPSSGAAAPGEGPGSAKQIGADGSPRTEAAAAERAIGDTLIVESQLVGSDVRLYHEAMTLAYGEQVSIQVAGKDCQVQENAFSVPARGGDAIDELIVIDRGGTPTTGMGPHGENVLRGVQQRVLSAIAAGKLRKVAILDSHGVNSQPRKLPLTADVDLIERFLDPASAPPSNGAGADPYGSALGAMQLLDVSDAPLKVVTLISDGIDPGEESGQGSQRERLVSGAAKRKLSVHGLHIDRSEDALLNARAKTRLQRGRNKLNGVADATGGVFRSVVATADLARGVKAQLADLMRPIAEASRTVCTLCGSNDRQQKVPVELRVLGEDGSSVVRRSRRDSRGGEMELSVAEFQRCEAAAIVEPESTPRSWLTMAGSGVAALLVVGLLLLRNRKQQALALERLKTDADAKLTEERTARLGSDEAREQASRQAAEERVQLQADLEEQSARAAQQQQELARLQEASNPELWVLSADAARGDFPLKAGSYLVGAGDDCQVVLDSPKVSARHALLEVSADRVLITDQNSTNGTYLNGRALQAGMAVETVENDIIAFSKTVTVKLERAK